MPGTKTLDVSGGKLRKAYGGSTSAKPGKITGKKTEGNGEGTPDMARGGRMVTTPNGGDRYDRMSNWYKPSGGPSDEFDRMFR